MNEGMLFRIDSWHGIREEHDYERESEKVNACFLFYIYICADPDSLRTVVHH